MGAVVLDDQLFVEYFKFKNGLCKDQLLLQNLLSNLKMPFITEPCQTLRCFNKLDTAEKDIFPAEFLHAALSRGSLTTQSLEELALKTKYHLILTADEDKETFPYLNINKPKIELNYTSSFEVNHSRDILREQIKALCSDAVKVIICDNYFFSSWEEPPYSTELFFDDLLPKKKLIIEFVQYGKNTKQKRKPSIESKFKDWSVTKYSGGCYSKSNHDRFLVIEKPSQSIEVMLSSGFLFLWKDTSEITAVFREV